MSSGVVTDAASLEGAVFCDADTCRIRNLCYDPSSSSFFVPSGRTSVFIGVPDERPIQLGTVDIDIYPFHFDIRNASSLLGARVSRVSPTALLMSRNLPDNLMHVLHDDLVPLFSTMRQHGLSSDFVLQLLDDRPSGGPHADLYASLSRHAVRHRSDLATLTCFRDAVVGLARHSLWYQYGFRGPQGALPMKSSAGHLVAAYVEHQATTWRLPAASIDTDAPIVLIERVDTRRILNADELAKRLESEFGTHVERVSLEATPFRAIAALLRRSATLVGMHGGALALAMFLPPGAALIELFPYAVPPGNYAPYATLAGLQGVNVAYRAWANANESASVTHPDWPPRLGGIAHLDVEEQERIMAQEEVPPHKCCSDPAWLFRAYQDTVVDIDAVIDLIRSTR